MFRFTNVLRCFACVAALGTGQLLLADDAAATPGAAANGAAGQTAATSDNVANSNPEGPLSRWLDINTLSFSARWRNMAQSDGFHMFDVGQERSLVDGRFKLDSEGKYAINFHVSSGTYFNWAYADFIGGGFDEKALESLSFMPPAAVAKLYSSLAYSNVNVSNLASGGWGMRVRQLYLSAAPIKQLEFQYGSLPISHGVNTEITTYDDDGYLSGGRAIYRDPQHIYLDEVSATAGFVGDYITPNVFRRGDSFGNYNYTQVQAVKKFGKRLQASADFTEHFGTHTVREAFLARMPETHVLDSVRLELYQRTNVVTLPGNFVFDAGNGVAVTGSKTLHKRITLEGGYASIDTNYGVLTGVPVWAVTGFSMNGDSYNLGNRLFAKTNIKLNSYFSLFGFYTHTVSKADIVLMNQQGMNFGLTVDFKQLLSNKAHIL